MPPSPACPARLILETVAGSPHADPADRAAAWLDLLVGNYPASMSLETIIGGSYKPAASAPLDVADLIDRMGKLAQ